MSSHPLWSFPFRPLFLGVAVFACLAVPAWMLQFQFGWLPGGVDALWHRHEMLLGFAGGTVVGFVLTAAQTWTGVRTINGVPLMLLVLFWLLARVGWALGWSLPAALADGLFYTVAALTVGYMTIVTRNWRNVFYGPVLLLLAGMAVYYAVALEGGQVAFAGELLNIVLFVILHVVLVVGGRVIPFFTDRGLKRPPTSVIVSLEWVALLSSLLYLGVLIKGSEDTVLERVALLVVVANAIRWLHWKPWQTLAVPLLWSLQLAYAALVLGFLFIAIDAPRSVAIHTLAVGGIGLMILAMISRVSLGHTGRPLQLPSGYLPAFYALLVALLSRILAGLLPDWYLPLLWVAAAGWFLAYGLFVVHYLPILLAPRPDAER